MKTIILILISLVSLASWGRSLTLSLGEDKVFSLASGSRIWIQDRQILRASEKGSHEIQIHGMKEGQTRLRIGKDLYDVQVVHPAQQQALLNLQESLRHFIGLHANLKQNELQVEGHLYRMADWTKLAEIMRPLQINYQMRAQLSESLQKEALKSFRDQLKKMKLPPQNIIFNEAPEVRVAGSALVLKKYQNFFSAYGVVIQQDEKSIDMTPTVKVQITVAEVRKDMEIKYGLKWSPTYTAQILGSGGGLTWDDTPFEVDALEANGYGKVLASPNLVCRSGEDAEFMAGGEIPIRMMNYRVEDIVWKDYGVMLTIHPVADSAGRMSISIETEVSSLDYSHAVEGIPSLLINRVSSHFDLSQPQTIALSGMIKSENQNSSEGLPLLSRVPILGPLFSSKDFVENRTELVIFVRPSILDEDEAEVAGSAQHLKNL